MENNKKYLIIIDGHAVAFRSYYALSRAGSRTKDGTPTWAVFGFTRVLIEIIESFKPEYVVMTFDTKEPTFRHEFYPEYKGNRGEVENDFIVQMPYIIDVVKAFNIPIYQKAGYEADDIIGTIAKKYEHQFMIDVITGDQDLMQLVTEKTNIYLPNKDGGGLKKYDIPAVIERYGVTPEQIVDFKAIKGDPSDNIPGVKGIGDKGATKLIQDFGSLENIYENIEKIEKERTRKLLLESKDNAFLSKKLSAIETNSPLDFNLDDWALTKPDETIIKDLFSKLEFRTLIEKLPKILANYDGKIEYEHHIDNNNNNNNNNEDDLWFDFNEEEHGDIPLEIDVKVPNSLEEVQVLVDELNKKEFFAIDLETTSLNTFEARIVGIAISYQDKDEDRKAKEFISYYIPIGHLLIEDLSKNLDYDKTLAILKPLLENENIKKVGHNLKYEISVFDNHNINLKGIKDDTLIADYVLNPNNLHGLKECAKNHLRYFMTNIEELIGKGKNVTTIDNSLIDDVAKYAGADSSVSLELSFYLREKMLETKVLSVYEDIDLPLVPVLVKMERQGIKVDHQHLVNLSSFIETKLKELEIKIYELAGKEFNINSSKQLSTILFEDMNIDSKGVKKNKTTGYSTDSSVLEKIGSEHEIIPHLMEYRQLTKIKSTYSDSIAELINKKTGKIHTNFRQTVATTGRLSSTDPNLQNIPIKTELGREIRRAFVPSLENSMLLSADYSQIELRLLAHYTKDPVFLDAFKNNLDIHSRTVMDIYGLDDISQVTPELRRVGKTVNFGIVYGQKAHGLAENLKISIKEASEIIKKFNEKYVSIIKYSEEMTYFANTNGFVETLFGRRRYLPDIYSANRSIREFAKRNAVNTPLQGTASDIIKIAMINIQRIFDEKNFKSKMLLQVHDELVFEVIESEMLEIKSIVKKEMESVFPELLVPLDVSLNIGKTWVEAK